MNDRKGSIGSGCLTFLAGLVTGVSLTVLLLVIWALVRPVDRTPLVTQIEPGNLDLEVVLSEAFLNEAISAELAANQVEDLGFGRPFPLRRAAAPVHADHRTGRAGAGGFRRCPVSTRRRRQPRRHLRPFRMLPAG